jgi:hypothetical protein
MARKAQKRSRRMKAIADPDTIAKIIERRGNGGPPQRLRLRIGKALSPARLVSALVQLHNIVNTEGPTTEWDDVRRWLFNYVDMYKSQLAMEDKTPEIAFRTAYIKTREPFAVDERRYVAEALSSKKQIGMQVRALKARRIWW